MAVVNTKPRSPWDGQIARHKQFQATLAEKLKAASEEVGWKGAVGNALVPGNPFSGNIDKIKRLKKEYEGITAKIKKAEALRNQWYNDQAAKTKDTKVTKGGTTKKAGGSTSVSSTTSGGSTTTYSADPSNPASYATNYTGIPKKQMAAINRQILAYQKMLRRGPAGANAAAGLEFDPQISALQRQMGSLGRQIPFGREQIYSWYGFDPTMKQNPHPASVLGRHMMNAQANEAAYSGFPADMANIASGIAGAMGGGANPGVGMIQQAGSEWSGLMGALGANQGAYDNNMQAVIAQSALDQAAGYTAGLQSNLAEMRGQLADLRSQKGKAKTAYRMDALDRQLQAQASLIDMMTAQALLPGQAAQISSGINATNADIANQAATLKFNYDQLNAQNQQWLDEFKAKTAASGETPETVLTRPEDMKALRQQAMQGVKRFQKQIVKGTISPQTIYNYLYQYLTAAGMTNKNQMHSIVMQWMRGIGPKYAQRYPKFFGGK